MSVQRAVCGMVMGALLLAGCSKSPPVQEEPGVFSIAATDEIVQEEELPAAPESKIVRADFNLDSLEDLAIAEEDNTIAIYLRKPGDGVKAEYYRAGGIRQAGEYTISALMSRKGPKGTDLVVIFNFVDGRKEMVQFQSEGTQFREIRRDNMTSKARPPAGVPAGDTPTR